MAQHEAVVLTGARALAMTMVPTEPLLPHEVQVQPRATGLCGSDLHYYQNGHNGAYVVKSPLVLGHEAAGEVVAVGSAVTTGVRRGDRVAIEPQLACFTAGCGPCRGGSYNLCPRMRFRGSASAEPPVQGSLQRLLNHPADLVYRLPDHVGFDEGAAVEPLSVALHAVRKGRVGAVHMVLVAGAGAIGLLCARVARIAGATTIVMVDVDASRLDFARERGLADIVYTMPMRGESGETGLDLSARVARDVTGLPGVDGRLSDVVFECTGVESCINLGISGAAPGGRVVLVGMGRPALTTNVGAAMVREVEIVSVWRYANTFPSAIELIAKGLVDVKPLLTHSYPLAEAAEALDLALTKPDNFIKAVVLG